MAKFVTIGERLSTTAPAVNKAFTERDPEPIIKRAKQQLDAGATYLDVNIGPAENDGEDLMKWAVQLLQSEFDNVPLALDTTNKKAIEAGISVYNRAKGKPIVNSADAGDRITNIDLAAANDAICIALCSSGMVAADNDERMMHCQNMLERGMSLGMEAEDLWFDPLFLVVKGMQDKQMEVLEAIKMFSDMGLNSTGGLSNNSNGMPKHTGGFTNNFEYKGFDLSIFFQWSYGNDVLNANRLFFENSNKTRDLNQYASYADRWTPENPESNIPRATDSGSNKVFSTRIIEDGSFLRLKTVSLGYTLPKQLTKKWKIDNARVFVAGQNLWTCTGYSGYDPEVSIREGALTPGLDFSAYPRAYSISFGINLGF